MSYYAQNLNALKLYEVYQTQLPAVVRYLADEIAFVGHRLQGTERVIELGAGYGRIIKELAPLCYSVTGVDIAKASVEFGYEYL